jgi:O-antigen ligase
MTGHIFHPAEPLFDSGGVLRSLPLPLSLLVCSGGLLLYGRYSHATAGLWTIFGLLFLMLISTAVAGGDSGSLDRAKMLLLLQILLPTFGLVLGAVLDPRGEHGGALRLAVFSVVALVVPAQLAATWLEGYRTLRQSVFLFGVYQHLQFVPVVLVCGYLAVLPGLWAKWGAAGRAALSIVLALLAVYAVAAHSVLAMVALFIGTALFGAVRLRRSRELAAAVMMIAVFSAFAGYVAVAIETYEFRYKFSFLFPPEDPWPIIGGYSAGVKPRLRGGWTIVGLPVGGRLLLIEPSGYSRQATLMVEGELDEGALAFLIEDASRSSMVLKASVNEKGPFQAAIPVDWDRGDGYVFIYQPGKGTRGVIRHLRWQFPAPGGKQEKTGFVIVSPAAASDTTAKDAGTSSSAPGSGGVRNVAERFSDWTLFGHGIFESPKALLFGHARPLAREQRSSAHNFYIDFTYNFGFLALLPLLALIAYTGVLLWRRRREVTTSESLFALAAVVAFLVLIESNLKVSLRQPYPGIAIYFLWGLLLARLREPATANHRTV